MTIFRCFSAFTFLGALTLSVPAWADIPPDDVCLAATVGESCNNAELPSGSTGPGVCQQSMCTRPSPDGGITYKCYRCVASDGGTGGQRSAAGGAGAGGDAGTNTSGASSAGTSSAGAPSSATGGTSAGSSSAAGSAGTTGSKSGSDDSGCSVSQARGGAGTLGAALIALGLTVAGLRRRRSLTS